MSVENNKSRKRRSLIRQWGGKCQECGYNRCLRALHFHHVDASEKYQFSKTGGASLDEVEQHPDRFRLMCANCHIEETDRLDKAKALKATCRECGREFRTQQHRLDSGRARFCSKRCATAGMIGTFREPLADRFMKYIRKEPSGCWAWTGYCMRGTGLFAFRREDGTHAPTTAVRVAFFLEHGEMPQRKLGRTCPTLGCVNPEHWKESRGLARQPNLGRRSGPDSPNQIKMF